MVLNLFHKKELHQDGSQRPSAASRTTLAAIISFAQHQIKNLVSRDRRRWYLRWFRKNKK